jgi:hypothetical protein
MDRYADIAARAGWTGAQAALSLLIVELGDVQLWWAVPLALALSAAKTWVVGRTKAAG